MADPRDFYRPDASAQFRPDKDTALQPAASAPSLNMVPGVMPAPLSPTDQGFAALKTMMPELDQFMAKQDKEYSDQEIQAGREAQLKEAMEYGAAVKAGKLAPNQSKWFMKGYKAQYGEAVGQQWALEAKTAWMGSDAKNSDDPNASATFLRDFTAKKLQTAAGMDADVRSGLLPQLSGMHTAVMAAQAEYSAKQVYEKNLELLGTNITSDIDAYISAQGKMSTAELFDKIKSRDAAGRLQGVQNDDLNKTIAEAFAQKARAANSVSLLKVVQQYGTVGNNPKYLGIIRAAQDAIETKSLAAENHRMALEAHTIRVNGQRALMDAVSVMQKQQAAGQPPHLTNDMIRNFNASGNPEAFMGAIKFAQEQRHEYEKPTPQEVKTVNTRLIEAGQTGALNEYGVLMDQGLIRGTEFANSTAAVVRTIVDNHFQSSKAYTEGTSRLQRLSNQSEMGPTMVDPHAVNDSVSGFQRDLTLWKSSHENATDAEVDKKKNELIDYYMNQLEPFKMMGGNKTYHRGDIRPQGESAGVQHQSTEDLLKQIQGSSGSVTGESILRKSPAKQNQKVH